MGRNLWAESNKPTKAVEVPGHRAYAVDVERFVLHFEAPELIKLCCVACRAMLSQWEEWIEAEIGLCPDTPPGQYRVAQYEQYRKVPRECLEKIDSYIAGESSIQEIRKVCEIGGKLERLPAPSHQYGVPQVVSSTRWLSRAIIQFEEDPRTIQGYHDAQRCLHYGDVFGIPFNELEKLWVQEGLIKKGDA